MMKLFVRYIGHEPNGVHVCQSFKVHEGEDVEVQVEEFVYETFPEIVIELDNGEVLRNVLEFEVV